MNGAVLPSAGCCRGVRLHALHGVVVRIVVGVYGAVNARHANDHAMCAWGSLMHA